MAQVLIATYGIIKMPYGAIEGGLAVNSLKGMTSVFISH
jgi:hypothetical protein